MAVSPPLQRLSQPLHPEPRQDSLVQRRFFLVGSVKRLHPGGTTDQLLGRWSFHDRGMLRGRFYGRQRSGPHFGPAGSVHTQYSHIKIAPGVRPVDLFYVAPVCAS